MNLAELLHVLSVDRHLHPHIWLLCPFTVTSSHRNSIRPGVVSCFDEPLILLGTFDQCGLVTAQPLWASVEQTRNKEWH